MVIWVVATPRFLVILFFSHYARLSCEESPSTICSNMMVFCDIKDIIFSRRMLSGDRSDIFEESSSVVMAMVPTGGGGILLGHAADDDKLVICGLPWL